MVAGGLGLGAGLAGGFGLGWAGLGWVSGWLGGGCSHLGPSPAFSSLKDASGFPLKLDLNQLASNADQLTFHWQSCGNWQIVGWLLGWGVETGG